MKRIFEAVAVAAAVLAIGCSDPPLRLAPSPYGDGYPPGGEPVPQSQNTGPSASDSPTSPSDGSVGSSSSGLTEIRILGENNLGNTLISAHVKGFSVKANGVALPLQPGVTDLNLANTSQAWLLGKVAVPLGVQRLQVTLQLDDYGTVEGPSGNGSVDYQGSPLTFAVETALLARNNHAVLHAQLDRMLTNAKPSNALVAVKNYVVRY